MLSTLNFKSQQQFQIKFICPNLISLSENPRLNINIEQHFTNAV